MAYLRTGGGGAAAKPRRGRRAWQYPGRGPYLLTYEDARGQQAVVVGNDGYTLRFRSLREAEWFRGRRRLHLPANVQVTYREDGKR